jgi:hypothetical protein
MVLPFSSRHEVCTPISWLPDEGSGTKRVTGQDNFHPRAHTLGGYAWCWSCLTNASTHQNSPTCVTGYAHAFRDRGHSGMMEGCSSRENPGYQYRSLILFHQTAALSTSTFLTSAFTGFGRPMASSSHLMQAKSLILSILTSLDTHPLDDK